MSRVSKNQGPLIKFFRFVAAVREPGRANCSAAG